MCDMDLLMCLTIFKLHVSAGKIKDIQDLVTSQYVDHVDYQQRFDPVHPNLQCPASGIATELCANDNCQINALICGHQECAACQRHQDCRRSTLETITELYNTRLQYLRHFLDSYVEIENRMMNQLAERRKRFYRVAFGCGFDDRYTDVMEALFYDRRDVILEGDITGDVEDRLREHNTFIEQYLKKDPLNKFEREAEQVCAQLQQLQLQLFMGLAPQIQQIRILRHHYQSRECWQRLKETNFASQPYKYSTDEIIKSVKYGRIQSMRCDRQRYYQVYLAQQCNKEDAGVFYVLFRVNEMSIQSQLRSYHRVELQSILVSGEMSYFINELSKFTELYHLSLRVLHKFQDWSCFDELADVINNRLIRLRSLELHTPEGQSHTWTQKLRRGIRVIYREEKDTDSVLGISRLSDGSIVRSRIR